MFRTFSPEAFLWLVQAPISPRREGAGLCGPIARYSSAADAMKRLILASKAPFSLMSPRPRGNVLIATVIGHYRSHLDLTSARPGHQAKWSLSRRGLIQRAESAWP